jgi:hypothetical protein
MGKRGFDEEIIRKGREGKQMEADGSRMAVKRDKRKKK